MTPKNVSRRGRPDRRQDILRTAAETFAERGFSASTTREIAERASSATIYYHFDSKEAMVVELVTTYLDELMVVYRGIAAGDGDAAAKLRELFAAAIRQATARTAESLIIYRDWPALVEIDPSFAERPREFELVWAGVIAEGVRSGDFRPDVDARLVYRLCMGAILWIPRWFSSEGAEDTERVARGFADLVLPGLRRADSSAEPLEP